MNDAEEVSRSRLSPISFPLGIIGYIKMTHFSFPLIIACYIAIVTILNGIEPIQCSEDEKRLMKHLREGYERDDRPVNDASLPLTVEIQLKLKQIVDLDVRNQILKTNLWLDYYWNDPTLVWNPVSTF